MMLIRKIATSRHAFLTGVIGLLLLLEGSGIPHSTFLPLFITIGAIVAISELVAYFLHQDTQNISGTAKVASISVQLEKAEAAMLGYASPALNPYSMLEAMATDDDCFSKAEDWFGKTLLGSLD